METTRYFEEQVRRKRPYLDLASIEAVLASPLRRETQPDGRIRFWAAVLDPRDGLGRYLRVITLEDGRTVHNAFYDRDFEG
jgi:hypothetical protein